MFSKAFALRRNIKIGRAPITRSNTIPPPTPAPNNGQNHHHRRSHHHGHGHGRSSCQHRHHSDQQQQYRNKQYHGQFPDHKPVGDGGGGQPDPSMAGSPSPTEHQIQVIQEGAQHQQQLNEVRIETGSLGSETSNALHVKVNYYVCNNNNNI